MEGYRLVFLFFLLVFFAISFLFGYTLMKSLEMIDSRLKMKHRWLWHIVFSIAGTWYLFKELQFELSLYLYALLVFFLIAVLIKSLAHTLQDKNTNND
jgi:hypothetical protein